MVSEWLPEPWSELPIVRYAYVNLIALQVVSVEPVVGKVSLSYLLNEELSESVSNATVDSQLLLLLLGTVPEKLIAAQRTCWLR